jgi:hypothetical protein
VRDKGYAGQMDDILRRNGYKCFSNVLLISDVAGQMFVTAAFRINQAVDVYPALTSRSSRYTPVNPSMPVIRTFS